MPVPRSDAAKDPSVTRSSVVGGAAAEPCFQDVGVGS